MMGVEEDVIRAEKLNKVFSKGEETADGAERTLSFCQKRRAHGSDRA